MMKKYICLACLILVMLSVLSCSNETADESENTSIVGTWEYSNHSELKEYLTDIFDESYFYKVYYQFDEDGTGRTWLETSADFKAEFTYSYDGKILAVTLQNGTVQELECSLDNDRFIVSDGEEEMVFKKID